jgi:tetrathionate reductase subunit A
MIEPLTGKTKDGRPFCTETFLIDLAEKTGLPGFGDHAIPGKDGKLHPLKTAEDFYLRAFANIAHNAELPEASAEEIAFVETNYPIAKYRVKLPRDQWKKVRHMLARGGMIHWSATELLFDAIFQWTSPDAVSILDIV